MINTKYFSYHLVDESPWPFLVSTASLFLTLGAVLFFHFFVQVNDDSIVLNVVSFMSLASKAKPKVLYLGGSILFNQVYNNINRNYSFRPIGIGNAKWNPNNYSVETQEILLKFKEILDNNDKESAYDLMYAVLGNKHGFFTPNYGKVSSIINNMVYSHNILFPSNQINEKEFLDRYNYQYNSLEINFLDKSNRGTIMSNVTEILAPKIVMNDNKNVLIERFFFVENKINLSFQQNPEYTVGLFARNNFGDLTLVIYDSDLKVTEDHALDQKYFDLISKQNLEVTLLAKEKFGINIFIVASRNESNSDIILTSNQISALTLIMKNLKKEYPEHFINFNEKSEEFTKFVKTGNANFLNKSNFPVVRYYRPAEFYKLPHDEIKFENTPVYKFLVDQVSKHSCLSNSKIKEESSVIIELLKDETNN